MNVIIDHSRDVIESRFSQKRTEFLREKVLWAALFNGVTGKTQEMAYIARKKRAEAGDHA